MKKLFTSMMLLVCTLAAMAVDYPGTLAVIIDGFVAQPTETKITINEQADGKYELSLKNFILVQGEDEMPVGNIVLKDVEAKEEEGALVLETVQDILIEEGDMPEVDFWYGPYLDEVPVELKATLKKDALGDVLTVDIVIPLVSLGQDVKVVFDSRNFQLPNSGFEEFHTAKAGSKTSDEPNNWHSFMSCTGTLAGMVSSVPHTFISEDVRPSSTGSKSVLVKSDKVMGIIANGTLTTGQLKAGGLSATSTSNCAFIDFSNTKADANGAPFYTVLNSFPDSIGVWVKFKQGSPVKDHPYATMTAVITDGSYYQEPKDKDYDDIIVGQAANRTIESTGEWQRIVVPFEYLNPDKAPKGILVTFSTNADPGQGTASDELYIDDVELIYSSYLSSIAIDGVAIPDFASDKYDYEYNFGRNKQIPSAEELVKMISCEGSKEIKTFVTVLEDNVASILVLSADLMSNRTYTITFVNEGYDITVAPTENGSIHVVPASKENQKIDIVAEPAEGYELARISVVGASGNPVEVETDGLGAMSFIMPAETVTITATFQEAYARLSDYTVSCEGKFAADGTVEAVITYKIESTGSYADTESYIHWLGAAFMYDVKDAQGNIVTSGVQATDVSDGNGTVSIFPNLQPDTEYTIVVTMAKVYDVLLPEDENIVYIEEGKLAATTFTTEKLPYVTLANYEISCDGMFDEDDKVTAVLTYLCYVPEEYTEDDIETSFTYDVLDASGDIVKEGLTTNTYDIIDNITVNLGLPNLSAVTAYTVNLTSVKMLDYTRFDYDNADYDDPNLEFGEVLFKETASDGKPLATVTFLTGIPTNIADIDTVPVVKADGKYIENGQIVIYRNGVKYNVAGVVIR